MNEEKQQNELRKEIGKWLLDVSKYVTTAVIITTFLGSMEHRGAIYLVGGLIASVCFGSGLIFLNYKRK